MIMTLILHFHKYDVTKMKQTEWVSNTNTTWFNSHRMTILNKAQEPFIIQSESFNSNAHMI
jgi:hypothetical protein